jgi:hypothetical protein
MKNINKMILGLIVVVFIAGLGFAEFDVNNIYGLMDENALKQIVEQGEKNIAINPSDKRMLKILGIAYHNLGSLKVNNAPAKAVKYLDMSLMISPDDYVVLAYLGSATTMVARDSWNFFTKLSEVNKGANLIDKAVVKAPTNIVIRVVRAQNSLQLPTFLNRKTLAKQDFLYVEELLKKNPSGLDPATKAAVFSQLGNIFRAEKDEAFANFYFQKASGFIPQAGQK